MVKTLVLLLALAVCVAGQANAAKKTGAVTVADASFPDWAAGTAAANTSASNLTTLLAAVQAAGLASSLNATTAWTILAPTNQAFAKRLREDLNLTPTALLLPANKETLVKVLSYHVIPSRAVLSSALKNGEELMTALAGAALIKVKLESGKKPRFVGATNSAKLQVADVKIGASVVHVVNDVLMPEGVGKGSGKHNGTTSKGHSKENGGQ